MKKICKNHKISKYRKFKCSFSDMQNYQVWQNLKIKENLQIANNI